MLTLVILIEWFLEVQEYRTHIPSDEACIDRTVTLSVIAILGAIIIALVAL